MLTIGQTIQTERKRQNISLRKCAKAAGISPAWLSQIESGDAYPSRVTLRNLCAALGLDSAPREKLLPMDSADFAAVCGDPHLKAIFDAWMVMGNGERAMLATAARNIAAGKPWDSREWNGEERRKST